MTTNFFDLFTELSSVSVDGVSVWQEVHGCRWTQAASGAAGRANVALNI